MGMIVVFFLVFSSPQLRADPKKNAPSSIKIPDKLAAYIPVDYRAKFQRLTGLEKSALHWNQGIVVYCNICQDVYTNNYIEFLRDFNDDGDEEEEKEGKSRYKKYPAGTVIVKDHFPLGKRYFLDEGAVPTDPTTIAVMIKHKKGYDPIHDDWQYGYFMPSGQVIAIGKGEDSQIKKLCSDCHRNIRSRDHIFSSKIQLNSAQK